MHDNLSHLWLEFTLSPCPYGKSSNGTPVCSWKQLFIKTFIMSVRCIETIKKNSHGAKFNYLKHLSRWLGECSQFYTNSVLIIDSVVYRGLWEFFFSHWTTPHMHDCLISSWVAVSAAQLFSKRTMQIQSSCLFHPIFWSARAKDLLKSVHAE